MPKMNLAQVHNLKGAVAPSEDAGKQFEIDMVLDAIKYHEEGDDTDAPCCTGDKPCDTRIFLVGRQRQLAGQVIDEKAARIEAAQVAEKELAQARRTPGNGVVADPASPKQIGFIKSLIAQHDASKIGTFPMRTLVQIEAGEEVSKGRASKLIEVLKRQPKQLAEIHEEIPTATAAQMGFVRTLCTEQGREIPTSLSKVGASDLITELLANRESGKVQTPKTGSKVTEDGMYRTSDGTIYKVQIAKQGSGRLYAKQLTEHKVSDDRTDWSFEYAAGAIHRLTPADKMTLEQAQEFGKLYGVCCRCAADLTDEKSIEAGIGPICAEKM